MLNVADTHQTSRRPKASYRHNDLFSLVAHGTPERAWASMDIRGIAQRRERRLSNVAVSCAIALFPGLV